jgi:Tubulin-tyrosine ligase family
MYGKIICSPEKDGLDVFDYVPLTFSFRTCEKTFMDDLQNFAKVLHKHQQQIYSQRNENKEPIELEEHQFSLGVDQSLLGQKEPPGGFHNIQANDVKIRPNFCSGKNLWILKPHSMSRGRGLELFTTLKELENFLRMYLNGYDAKDFKDLGYSPKAQQGPSLSSSKKKLSRRMLNSSQVSDDGDDLDEDDEENKRTTFQRFIVQKYIEKPMLFHQFKFDIRVYACLTHERELFVFRYSSDLAFRESYVRLSSYEYTLEKLNYYIHLTNNAVQSSCPAYGKLKNGNIFPISDLESYAISKGKEAGVPSFMDQIKSTIKTCFNATVDILNPLDRKHCFEMFGFDFMVDESYKVWLLECNSGPSLNESNEFLSSLIKRALGNLG